MANYEARLWGHVRTFKPYRRHDHAMSKSSERGDGAAGATDDGAGGATGDGGHIRITAARGEGTHRQVDNPEEDHSLWTDERAILRSIGAMVWGFVVVLLLGVVAGVALFAISGLWPPFVAVPSASMSPNMQVGDLVVVVDDDRYVPESAHGETGVVTYQRGQNVGYTKFGRPGDVIVYHPDGTDRVKLIHRAMFHVNESENWYAKGRRVNRRAVGNADNCGQLSNCPAPNAGFITKGDNVDHYDQADNLSAPVRPKWVHGTAAYRVPWLGYVRFLPLTVRAPG